MKTEFLPYVLILTIIGLGTLGAGVFWELKLRPYTTEQDFPVGVWLIGVATGLLCALVAWFCLGDVRFP